MANTENLKPFTKDNAKEFGKKGGKVSGKVRRERKSIKEQLDILLNMPVSKEEKIKRLEEAGFQVEEMNNGLLLNYTLFEKALTGDVKATSLIFRTLQEEDNEKNNKRNDNWNDILGI